MTKTFTTIDIVTICAWYKECREKEEKPLNDLPLKTQWLLKKNITALQPIAESFMTFRDENEKNVQAKYMDDEHSEESTDENDNPIRKIREKYQEDFSKDLNEINMKLSEIALEENSVDIEFLNIEALIDDLPEHTSLTIDDLEILNFMDKEDKDTETVESEIVEE